MYRTHNLLFFFGGAEEKFIFLNSPKFENSDRKILFIYYDKMSRLQACVR